jgi:hypothetical protein
MSLLLYFQVYQEKNSSIKISVTKKKSKKIEQIKSFFLLNQ